jgi:hypothetical protein
MKVANRIYHNAYYRKLIQINIRRITGSTIPNVSDLKKRGINMERVKFFSASDMGCGIYLQSAEFVMDKFDENITITDVNDVLELYNIKQFFDHNVYLTTWAESDITRYKGIVSSFQKKIGKFFSEISNDNMQFIFDKIESEYHDDFWTLFESLKVFERITADTFGNLIEKYNISIYDILKRKNIVRYYGNAIRVYLLKGPKSAELLIDKYEVIRNQPNGEIYFPTELTLTDKEGIIVRYIDGDHPNINYLRIIENVQSEPEFKISIRTKQKAKHRVNEEINTFFEGIEKGRSAGIERQTTVSFSNTQKEEAIHSMKGNDFEASYSTQWIRDNLDNSTLLNNFIYLFEYADQHMRILAVSKKAQLGVFERHLSMHTKKEYMVGTTFEFMEGLASLQMHGYYHELLRNHIRLEDVISWFFKEYVPTEFGINDFRITMPSEGSTFLDKCRCIMPTLESILKQYHLYCEDGHIDHELLQFLSEHLFYKNVPSIINLKYVYSIGDEYKRLDYYLFSDQCMLAYIQRVDEKYRAFYDLISHEKISRDDYPTYLQNDLDWLITNNYIYVNLDCTLCISDSKIGYILRDLHENEVACYQHYSAQYHSSFQVLSDKGLIEFESTLYSRPEQAYFNYYLNKAEFCNGLNLRNIYSHGTEPSGIDDEKVHEANYFIFLRLFVLTLIKINDELCLKENLTHS